MSTFRVLVTAQVSKALFIEARTAADAERIAERRIEGSSDEATTFWNMLHSWAWSIEEPAEFFVEERRSVLTDDP